MNCHEAIALLPTFSDGELDAVQSAAMEKHVLGCAECSAQRDALTALRRRALGRVGPRNRQVDGGHGRQPLRGAHEGVRLVRVVGAFGLTQQRGDASQHFVVGHSDKLRERCDSRLVAEPTAGHSPFEIQETTSLSTWSRSGSLKTSW